MWLDRPEDGAARAGELCARHTTSLAPPRGWSVVDRRDNRTRAAMAPKTEPAKVAPRPGAAQVVAPVAPVVTLPPPAPPEAPRFDFDVLAPIEPVAPVAPVVPTPVEPVAWYPRFERGDSLDGVLEATTPLLARAFGNVRAI